MGAFNAVTKAAHAPSPSRRSTSCRAAWPSARRAHHRAGLLDRRLGLRGEGVRRRSCSRCSSSCARATVSADEALHPARSDASAGARGAGRLTAQLRGQTLESDSSARRSTQPKKAWRRLVVLDAARSAARPPPLTAAPSRCASRAARASCPSCTRSPRRSRPGRGGWPARGRTPSACRRAGCGRAPSRATRSRCARSISRSSRWPMPPSRAWPNSSVARGHELHRALLRHRALGDHDDREVAPARVAPLDQPAHLLDVERPLGDQDHVGAAGQPGVQRDPARVAAHHLDDHHPVVALGGRVQPVDRVGRDLHGGVEAERHVGAAEVVVDRLRHADDRQAVLAVQPRGRARACPRRRSRSARRAAARASFSRIALRPVVALERVRARRAEDRPAAGQDAARRLDRQLLVGVLERPAPAVPEADDLVAVVVDALADDRPGSPRSGPGSRRPP